MATTLPDHPDHPSASSRKVVAFSLEWVAAFKRNHWSPSNGMGGRLGPEYAGGRADTCPRTESATAMIDLFIDRLAYPCAQPKSPGIVSLPAVLRYNRRGEIPVEEPGGKADSFGERWQRMQLAPEASAAEASASHGTPAGD
jgi:hypothetical protein